MLASPDDRYRERPVYSVSALARRARLVIEENFGFVQVEGEISNLRRPGSGHWYFTLKDDSAQLRCAMFAGRNRHVRFQPRDGQQVLVRGRVSLYEARGDFQLIADSLEPAGEGALRAAFEALKQRLDAEGLFAEARKRPLPALPLHLTIVSSPSGAALRDVLHVIERRFPALKVTLVATLVQGEGAERTLVDAIRRAGTLDTDVVLVTRGGGSLEDLWSFNLEAVARAVAACPHPVVSAIGHQTDFTIVDFVADLRAPTPSAAAELITPSRDEIGERLSRDAGRLHRACRHDIRFRAQTLALARSRLTDPRRQLQQQMQLTDDLERRLALAVRGVLRQERQRVEHVASRLRLQGPARALPELRRDVARAYLELCRAATARTRQEQLKLAASVRALQAVSPLNTLARGYAVLTEPETLRPITSVASVSPGSAVTAFLADGALDLEVRDVQQDRQLAPDV
jgi:exodeoxyribonuclease VII large subunit